MGAVASQITSLEIVYLTVNSGGRSKKASKPHVTGLCAGNSPVTGEFPAQQASNAENVSFHDVIMWNFNEYLCFWNNQYFVQASINMFQFGDLSQINKVFLDSIIAFDDVIHNESWEISCTSCEILMNIYVFEITNILFRPQ